MQGAKKITKPLTSNTEVMMEAMEAIEATLQTNVVEEYKALNELCDMVLEKIAKRKSKQPAQ